MQLKRKYDLADIETMSLDELSLLIDKLLEYKAAFHYIESEHFEGLSPEFAKETKANLHAIFVLNEKERKINAPTNP